MHQAVESNAKLLKSIVIQFYVLGASV